jgi:hypothetical protein
MNGLDDETRFFIFYLVLIYISAYVAFNAYDLISIPSVARVVTEVLVNWLQRARDYSIGNEGEWDNLMRGVTEWFQRINDPRQPPSCYWTLTKFLPGGGTTLWNIHPGQGSVV